MIAALLWKEWREQGWRLVLCALVLSLIGFSLVRAQNVPAYQTILLVLGPLSTLVAIFLAMGPIAKERSDETWSYLIAQPIETSQVVRTKWLFGALGLLAIYLLTGLAITLAAVSRDMFSLPAPPDYVTFKDDFLTGKLNRSANAIWLAVALSFATALSIYTLLLVLLIRARNELTAGLGGIMVTIALLLWMLQYPMYLTISEENVNSLAGTVFWCGTFLNPFAPLISIWEDTTAAYIFAICTPVFWIAAPVLLIPWLIRKGWAS